MRSYKLILPFVCMLVVLVGSGCQVAVPFIDSFKSAGLTEGDRANLLAKNVKEFQDARYWGDQNLAAGFILPEKRNHLQSSLRKTHKDERIIESRVDFVNFLDESRAADVDVVVRSFTIPYYVVNERTERQHWTFTVAQGWLIADLSQPPKDEPPRGDE